MNSHVRESTGRHRSLFWRLWFRSLVVRRPQAAVAVVSLLVGAAVASMLLNLYGDVHRKMTREFRSYGANVILGGAATKSSGPASLQGLMNAAAYGRVESLRSEIKGLVAAPVLYVVARLSRLPEDPRLPASENVVAVGTDFAALRVINPGWRVDARQPGTMLESGACAVGSHLAASLHLKLGDTLRLELLDPKSRAEETGRPQVFRVASVVSTGASEDDQVFVPLADLERLAELEGKLSLIEMNIPGDTPEIEQGAREIASAFTALRVHPVRQIVYSQGRALDTIRGLMISLMILILLIIALCVMATMTAIVLERRKDIAVMKALGASNRDVTRLLVTEGASLGLVAGFLGFVVGGALASVLVARLFGVGLNLVWQTLPIVWIATILLAALATLLTVGVMRRIQPATALKGE